MATEGSSIKFMFLAPPPYPAAGSATVFGQFCLKTTWTLIVLVTEKLTVCRMKLVRISRNLPGTEKGINRIERLHFEMYLDIQTNFILEPMRVFCQQVLSWKDSGPLPPQLKSASGWVGSCQIWRHYQWRI